MSLENLADIPSQELLQLHVNTKDESSFEHPEASNDRFQLVIEDSTFKGKQTSMLLKLLSHELDHLDSNFHKLPSYQNTVTLSSTAPPDQSSPPHISFNLTLYEKPEKISLQDFQFLKILGVGSFAHVFKVKKKDTGDIYAIKVLEKKHICGQNMTLYTMLENHILKNIQHPFIVTLKYAFQTETHLYMVIDYLDGGDLYYNIYAGNRFNEAKACFYISEIVSALSYIHEQHICHGDIKPENIVLDKFGHVCLIDFGLSRIDQFVSNTGHKLCGTVEYCAPEIVNCQSQGKGVDWWSLGVLIYEMITQEHPFYHPKQDQMFHNITTIEIHVPSEFSPEVRDLILRLLNRDPCRRLGSGPNGSADVRSHPWFSSIDWEALDRREIIPPFVPTHHQQPISDHGSAINVFSPGTDLDFQIDGSNSFGEMNNKLSISDFNGFSYSIDIENFNLIKRTALVATSLNEETNPLLSPLYHFSYQFVSQFTTESDENTPFSKVGSPFSLQDQLQQYHHLYYARQENEKKSYEKYKLDIHQGLVHNFNQCSISDPRCHENSILATSQPISLSKSQNVLRTISIESNPYSENNIKSSNDCQTKNMTNNLNGSGNDPVTSRYDHLLIFNLD